jgi:hypothetical protein
MYVHGCVHHLTNYIRPHVLPIKLCGLRFFAWASFSVSNSLDTSKITMSSIHTTGSQDAKANMPFIRKNNLYSTEKAYNADVFTANIPPSNVKTEMIWDIQITDLRPHKDSFCFNQHGFEILNFTSSLDPADWSDQQKIESVYCRELGRMMKKHLGASAIQVFETQVN